MNYGADHWNLDASSLEYMKHTSFPANVMFLRIRPVRKWFGLDTFCMGHKPNVVRSAGSVATVATSSMNTCNTRGVNRVNIINMIYIININSITLIIL